MAFIDTHAHLDEDAFSTDLDEVVHRAAAVGVEAILTIGTTAASSERAVELAARFPTVFAVVGIQPNYVSAAGPTDWDRIVELARAPKVVAIGETGLDRYWDHTPFEQQQEFFQRHLELARNSGLPVVIHCREAEADVVAQLTAFAAGTPLAGVMHSFCGDASTAESCLELGLHLSFAGMLTYRKNEELRQVAGRTPLERVLVETDSPYLSPTPHRGKRNEPAHVVHTAQCLADCLQLPLEEVARAATANARRLFQLP